MSRKCKASGWPSFHADIVVLCIRRDSEKNPPYFLVLLSVFVLTLLAFHVYFSKKQWTKKTDFSLISLWNWSNLNSLLEQVTQINNWVIRQRASSRYEAHGKFGEDERCVRVARGVAEKFPLLRFNALFILTISLRFNDLVSDWSKNWQVNSCV